MTPEERKRGLRAAVEAKLQSHMESKRDAIDTLCSSSPEKRAVLSFMVSVQILWDIIDSLVEECADLDAVLAEFMADVEAVGVRTVGMDWPDLLVTFNKARLARRDLCLICNKPKGQPPDRCPGHYESAVRPSCCRKHQDLGHDDGGFCAGAPVRPADKEEQ
jgi:hypothetical protein